MNIGPFHRFLDPSVTLGQITIQPWSEPPALPAPTGIDHWLFERPLTSGVALAIFALACFLVLRSRGKQRLALVVGGGLATAACGAALAGMLVTTDRERIADQTGALIDAVARGDVRTVDGLLSDRMVFILGGRSGVVGAAEPSRPGAGRGDTGAGAGNTDQSPDKRWALVGVGAVGSRVDLTDHESTLKRAVLDGRGVGRTQARITVKEPKMGFAISWWQFTWHREGDAWRVRTLELLSVNGKKPGPEVEADVRRLTK